MGLRKRDRTFLERIRKIIMLREREGEREGERERERERERGRERRGERESYLTQLSIARLCSVKVRWRECDDCGIR